MDQKSTEQRRLRFLFLLFGLAIYSSPVFAERVAITSSHYDAVGQGWLFGASANDGAVQCWIAVPAHIISLKTQDNENIFKEAKAFTYTDKFGNAGFSGAPVLLSEVPNGITISGGIHDLAFAPVAGGRDNGQCLSRLGPPKYLYDQILRNAPTVNFQDVKNTSYQPFSMDLTRIRSDDFGGGMLILNTTDKQTAGTILKQGVSGSVGEVSWDSKLFPFAMILKLDSDNFGQAYGIRFDVIKAIFERINLKTKELPKLSGYEIITFRARVTSSVRPTLEDWTTCWKLKPVEGEKFVELVIAVDNSQESVSLLQFFSNDKCQKGELTYNIDQRAYSSDRWVKLSSCQFQIGENPDKINPPNTTCRLDLRAPRQFRVRIATTNTIGISTLILR